MGTYHKHSNLEDRLIDFSVSVVAIASKLQTKREIKSISDQILRSGVSSALNYSEAIHAESRKDFIHKMKISLKELRETYTGIRILISLPQNHYRKELMVLRKENNELLSIFVSSVKTAEKNSHK
jgi:four helix bundle protein